jgi:hypothetical protein
MKPSSDIVISNMRRVMGVHGGSAVPCDQPPTLHRRINDISELIVASATAVAALVWPRDTSTPALREFIGVAQSAAPAT